MFDDELGDQLAKTGEAIDAYLHTYYEDIEDLYLENIYKLNILRFSTLLKWSLEILKR